MNLLEIVNSELNVEETYILEEGLFSVSPAIAFIAFKDSVLEKAGTLAKKTTKPIKTAIGTTAGEIEKIKAKTIGKSGNSDNDTVYSLTKEQKKVMAYIYKKYGADIVNDIEDFRKNVMPPYQLIKRNVAKYHSLTNKELHGMTKEEYYKYRESGRKKIEKKSTYFKDAKSLNSKQEEARQGLDKARKVYRDFLDGKIIDLTATNIEKILDEAGLGRKNLNGWSDSELEKTSTEIKNVMAKLNDPKKNIDGNIIVRGKGSTVIKQSKEQLEYYIERLKEQGYSAAKGKKNEDTGDHHGSFKDALAMYMIRKEEIRNMKQNSTTSEFRKYYEKVLKNAVDSAEKIYKEKFDNYASLKGTVELNQFEKKIWGLKATGVEHSGNINDWYLKIKPEDFIETKYYKKADSVIEAEKEVDKLLKRLESKLKKSMSEEDLSLCKKYRLFNNFLTVKELKDPKNMFKDTKEIPKKYNKSETQDEDADLEGIINSAIGKEYTSIKELEEQQEKLKKIVGNKKLPYDLNVKYTSFMKRINPKNGSEATKVSINKINSIINKINSTSYTGKTQANSDYKELEDVIDDFTETYGAEELSKFSYDINKAKSKLIKFINDKDEK